MAEWKSLVSSHTLQVEQFAFSGGEKQDITLHCRTLGTLHPGKDNAVLLLHGTTGSGLQFLQPEMADPLFGSRKPLDSAKYFLILPDAIGHGESSKPSTSSGASFPQYSYTDIVKAQHRLVRELFGVQRLRLILGTSMGGMNTWMWGYLYPATAKALMPIACLPQKLAGRNLLFRRLMLAIIEAGTKCQNGHPNVASEAVGLAWNVFQMMVSSPAKLERELGDPEVTDRHILDTMKKGEGNDPLDVLWEFRASSDYDPGEHLSQILAPLLTVNFADDQINAAGFPTLDKLIAKVSQGRAVIVDAGENALGHQSLSRSELWQSYVTELLVATE